MFRHPLLTHNAPHGSHPPSSLTKTISNLWLQLLSIHFLGGNLSLVNQGPASQQTLNSPSCLIQLSPSERTKLAEPASKCNPPLDERVVELLCYIPYIVNCGDGGDGLGKGEKTGEYEYAVLPTRCLLPPPLKYECGRDGKLVELLVRGMDYEATLPPYLVQLTPGVWLGEDKTVAVDVRSGGVVEIRTGDEDDGFRVVEGRGARGWSFWRIAWRCF